MAENTIELKSVGDLLEMNFFIPSYQRGYRWTKEQVEALLNDIDDFDKRKDGSFYCLQPLVVKEREQATLEAIKKAQSINQVKNLPKGSWSVIDGQQRLTTIHLILNVLGSDTIQLEYDRGKYILDIDKYECKQEYDGDNSTKWNKYLTDIWKKYKTDKSSIDKIEFFFLLASKICIWNWMNKKDNLNKDRFKDKLLNYTNFIWYNVGNITEEREHEMFSNLNSGKIPLTNAELIKALLLNNVNAKDNKERKIAQSLIADEYDRIERTLRTDDFWYFIAGKQDKSSSCINLLFDVMLDSSDKSDQYSKEEKYRTFFYFNDLINKENQSIETVWKDIQRYFHILDGWFADPVKYNLIGFLRGVKSNEIPLCDLYKMYDEVDIKTDFISKLKEECKNPIQYTNNKYLELRFDKNKQEVFNLMLLLNIATLDNKTKFSFADIHKNNWDIEHISPQNPDISDENLKKLFESYKEKGNNLPEPLGDLDSLLNGETINGKTLDEEKKKFFAIDNEDVMSVSNLTLLRDHENRGIGNMFFFQKRDQLREYSKQGCYIPSCSMNVFMKFYSKNPKEFMFWDNEDREQYLSLITESISNFFKDKHDDI